MSKITRYVMFELLAVFLAALAGMTVMVLLAVVAQEAVRQGLGPEPIAKLIPYFLPDALRFAVPGTMLFAVCSVYGRIAANNEVVAVKSVGISPMALLWPALALSFVVSLSAVWLNDLAVTWGRQGVHRVVVQSVEQIAYGMLRTRRSYSAGKVSINVRRVTGRTLERPTVVFHGDEGKPSVFITAQSAQLRRNADQNTLSIFLTDSSIEIGETMEGFFPGTIERVIPLSAASKKGVMSQGPSECPLHEIPREIVLTEREVERLEQAIASEAAFQLLTGDLSSLVDEKWETRSRELASAEKRLARLKTEPWRRWANGFSCFFFVLVGAPLAIRMRTSDFWSTFGACFLPILVVYYPLLAFGVDRAKSGALPAFSVWLGNGVLMLVGGWMLRRVVRM